MESSQHSINFDEGEASYMRMWSKDFITSERVSRH